MKSFIKEFKEFAMKGSVMGMAIGVIIGGAFGKIVTSLVDDLIMPILGIFTGGVNFADLKYVMTEDNAIAYGAFIQNIIDFCSRIRNSGTSISNETAETAVTHPGSQPFFFPDKSELSKIYTN